MIALSTTPEQTMGQLADVAEEAALEAVRLTLAAYTTRAKSIAVEAARALETAREYAARVTEAGGDLHLLDAEYAAHGASLLALEAHVLSQLHKRLSVLVDTG